jgi:chorismate mutase
VVYFIGRTSSRSKSIDDLREELFTNTKELVSLFQDRVLIAGRIAELKRRSGKPVRDRNRELAVIDSIGHVQPNVRRFLSLLFELTIWEELGSPAAVEADSGMAGKLSVSAEAAILEKVCASFFCSPGVEIYSVSGTGKAFLEEAAKRGAHIIEGDCEGYDLKVCLNKSAEGCSLVIAEGQPLDIGTDLLSRREGISRILLDGA